MASITFPNYSGSAGKNLTYFLSNSFSSVSTCCSTFDKLQRILREYFLPRFTFKLTSWYYSEHRLLVSTFALEFFHQFSRCNSFTSLFFFFSFFFPTLMFECLLSLSWEDFLSQSWLIRYPRSLGSYLGCKKVFPFIFIPFSSEISRLVVSIMAFIFSF